MSATAALDAHPPAGPAGPGATTPGATRRRWRPRRSTVVVVVALLLAVLLVVLTGGDVRTDDPLDPDNPGPGGAQAVARVLADSGVDVTVARGRDELARTDLDGDTLLLVVDPDRLGRSALAAVADLAEVVPVVVAGAGPGPAEALGTDVAPVRLAVDDVRAADCPDDFAGATLDGLRIQVDSAWAYAGDGCFPGSSGDLVTSSAGLTLLGAEQALGNDQVLRADNAAVALRLLGQRERLVWYVPSLADVGADEGVALRSLLPAWLVPGLWLLGVMVVATALWRGRRLGPLAREPLPVVVRATETTDSLGRLYRRSGDRAHAARTLRAAARRRAVRRLQLGRSATPEQTATGVAVHLGLDPAAVAALLDPEAPTPATDADLITLATDLAALDREVRRA